MQNNRQLNITIESGSYTGRETGHGSYLYNLVKYLSIAEKKDRFFLWDTKPALFRKSRIDFRQHNIKPWNLLNRLLFRADILHLTDHCMPPDRLPGPVIATVHDIAPLMVPDMFDPSKRKIFSANLERLIAGSSAIISPSQRTKDDLSEVLGVESKKITVIPEGVDGIFCPQTNYSVGLVKTRYSIKRPYILYVGSLDERKNIEGLLASYALLKHENPPDLVIAGSAGWLREPLSKAVIRLDIGDRVINLGPVPRKSLPALYSGAELMIWPSRYEGFGLPLLEAMSCAAPIVSSRTSSIPEVVGDAGILVDPEDTDELAYSMRKVLADQGLQQSMRKKSLERAAGFSAKKMALQTLELYRKAALN